MRKLSYRRAITEAIDIEMANNPDLYMIGEDIGVYGGVFKATQGLIDRYGPERVIDTPISETGIIGIGIGAAMNGTTMICEIMLSDLLCLCMDQIVNQAAKVRYMCGGDFRLPLVIRTATGVRKSFAAQHSQTLYHLFTSIPGIIVVAPSTPQDAKGLLLSALRCSNLVMIFEHKNLYPVVGEVPEGEYTSPLGKAVVRREGSDVTVVATSFMVGEAVSVAESLQEEKGYSIEVIDPCTLKPLDERPILDSVRKTGRLIVVDEGCRTGNYATEIMAKVNEGAFDSLKTGMVRMTSEDTPVPFSPMLEEQFLPNREKIRSAVECLLG
jgi:pyruvate/2-oxoglutarate/acetoin dehydrogenase E1 component